MAWGALPIGAVPVRAWEIFEADTRRAPSTTVPFEVGLEVEIFRKRGCGRTRVVAALEGKLGGDRDKQCSTNRVRRAQQTYLPKRRGSICSRV